MSRVFSVARMVFKKKSLSPAYYWMIIGPNRGRNHWIRFRQIHATAKQG